ncbi:MAG: hypothetical protein IAX21_06005 [Candidatus Bathyarchaeota archaeon]|nr:MAG: hypothetical protein NUK63_11435 [Candidatus Bathyarchaeum tardum]WNZ28235.1 MAG: hypothetical protein IAX21_06005 [Candidatus Bathyarchaeota archaeon]
MVSDINVTETIEDKKSWFNIKRFKIGGNNFQKPEKSMDVKNLNKDTYSTLKEAFKFYEATKVIKKYDNLMKLYDEDDSQKINQFFYKRDWLSGVPNVVNFTFEFNPFNYVNNIDHLSWFFDQYYPYSKLILTVPNIKLKKTFDNKTQDIINLDSYLRFVDSVFEILNNKNCKPIFVPISMRMGIRKLNELMQHYLKKEYYYYWFDFESQPINETSLGRLRHIFNIIKKDETFDKVISYFTNIRREKLSNSHDDTSIASDALSAIAGANLIGVNREPQRYFIPKSSSGSRAEEISIRKSTDVDPSHKARIFDRETYYYVKTTDSALFPKNRYVPINAAKLNAEFSAQTEYFLQNHDVETLLNQKSMFKDENAGNMLKELTSRSVDLNHTISDFW